MRRAAWTERTFVPVTVATGLALADAPIVVLALPSILNDFHASVIGVAAVIGAYTLALTAALPAAIVLQRALGPDPRRSATRLGGFALLALALTCLGCGLAGDLVLLVTFRALQGAAAAAALVAAFGILRADLPHSRGRRAWAATAVLGVALGPALGGALTELLSWRAIFLVQVPLLTVAGIVCLTAPQATAARPKPVTPAGGSRPAGSALGSLLCLGLLSAALTGVLFLLVLLLVSGWALSPLHAAAVVSVLPVGAVLGTRVRGGNAARALVGCVLVGAGVMCLAFLPLASTAMTLVPQIVAGFGMGLALPALADGLLGQHDVRDAGRQLGVRHLAITLMLVVLAPLSAAQLDSAGDQVRLRGTALILDANLPISAKLELARLATANLNTIAPRAELRSKLGEAEVSIGGSSRGAFEQLRRRADQMLVSAINQAFRPGFLVCGALAFLAAAGLLALTRPRIGAVTRMLCFAAVLLVPAQAALAAAIAPAPVALGNPCHDQHLPHTSGPDQFIQDTSLSLLNRAACHYGSSAAALALALVDKNSARDYQREYGVDPQSAGGLLSIFEHVLP